MIIPDRYIIRSEDAESSGKRTVTVRRYSTTIRANRNEIVSGFTNGALVFGREFGIIQGHDLDSADRNPRALCGLVGEKSIVLLNDETNNLDYLRIRHVLLSTLMVEFVLDSKDNLEILVFGDIRAKNNLWEMLRYDFGILPSPTPRNLKPDSVRHICEKYFDFLNEVSINPFEQDGWHTIRSADFKAHRGKYIDPSAERMRQVYRNKEIRIRSFESVLLDQFMTPMLQSSNVRFSVLQDSGVSFDIPDVGLPSHMNEIEQELFFYDFVRMLYAKIVDNDDLFEPFSERIIRQLSLIEPGTGR